MEGYTRLESIEKRTEKKMPGGEELKAMTTHCRENDSRPRRMEFISPIVGTMYLYRERTKKKVHMNECVSERVKLSQSVSESVSHQCIILQSPDNYIA